MDKLTTTKIFALSEKDRREIYSLDFNINGQSLYQLTGAEKRGMCGRFSSNAQTWNQSSANAIMLDGDQDPNLSEGQFMLFVCSMCADLGCGAIICKISRDGDTYIWEDFAYEAV